MDLPRGARPNIRMSQEELERCPRDGKGTLDDPLVIWAARLTDRQRGELAVPEMEEEADLYRAVDANTDIAKAAAVRSGCTVAWIICPVHAKKYVYDRSGNRIPTKWDRYGNPTEYRVVDADPHVTVRLGMSEDLCVLHGHLNVLVDERGFPVTFMSSFQRLQSGRLTNNDDRPLELFEWIDKEVSNQELLEQEAADYELFKTLTVSNAEGWEIEEEQNDNDYDPGTQFEAPSNQNTYYIPREENTGLDPEFEDYIVRKWSPYQRHPTNYQGGGPFTSVHNFGYDTRKFNRYYSDRSHYSQSHCRSTQCW